MEKAEYERRFTPRLLRAARCLLWLGPVDRHGCPRVKVKGRMVTLGRLTYLTFRGPVPKGQQVRHQRSCMSRRCVNPQHLFWWGRDPSGNRPPVWRAHILAWRLTQQSVRKLLERGGRGDGKLKRRVTRLMVLEEHAQTIELLKTRINGMLSWETEMKGLPLPEVGADLDVLGRMFEQHFKLQQALGYIPSGGLYAGRKARHLGEDRRHSRGFLAFVEKMAKMPGDQFADLLRVALGPPPPGTQPVDTVSDVTPRRADDE
jgi:hypothetical protein